MVSRQQVQILIEAQENVSKVAKKAEEALSKLGKTGSQGMNMLNRASNMISSSFSKLHSFVDRAREKFNNFVNSSNKLGMIRSGISNAATSFGQLINSSNLASRAMEKLKSVSDGIQAKFTSLKAKITSFGSSAKATFTSAFSLSGIKQRLTSLGGSIDKIKAKLRSLANEAKKTGGGGGFGFLKNALSMTVGMLGYDLVNATMESTRASLNARSSMGAFAQRLNMSGAEVQTYQKSLDNLQGSFKKVDMDVVGQQATDMAFRLGIGKESLTELTETTAIFTDAMQRNGRSAEDSMLAMSDAMDGQFVRLKEIGIGEEDLMRNGWSGDLEDKTGLLKAMNKALKEQHYDELAKSVDNLDDAWKVLEVTMGNLLEAILLPLLPAIVGVVSGFADAVNTIKAAWNGLPDWGKYAIGVAAVAVGIGIAVGAFGGLQAAVVALAGPLMSAIGLISGISLPIVAVVAAIGLLVYAIYEIGKAFGWWYNVQGMIQAIQTGIARLWAAFINHPDVQGFIKDLGQAWADFSKWVSGAWQETLKFFGINSGDKFYFVSSLIKGIGDAWQFIKPIVMLVAQGIVERVKLLIGVIQGIVGAVKWVIEGFQSLYTSASETWSGIMAFLGPYIEIITNTISGLVSTFDQFKQGQLDLPGAIIQVVSTLWTGWSSIVSRILSLVFSFASQILTASLGAGANLVTGFITWIMQLPIRVLTYLLRTRAYILSQLLQWVTMARQRAMQLLTGIVLYFSQLPGRILALLARVGMIILAQGMQWVINAKAKAIALVHAVISFLSQLPGRVLSALASVVSSIVSAGGQWVSTARSKASELVSAVVDQLTGLPGKVTSALSGVASAVGNALSGALDTARSYASQISNTISNINTRPMQGGMDLDESQQINIANPGAFRGSVWEGPRRDNNLKVQQDMNLNINVSGLPRGMTKQEFIAVLTDRDVISQLVNNNNFQSLDRTVKNRANARVNRSLGA